MRRVLSSIYGLKQAGRQFNRRFHKSLVNFGLTRSEGDPCCYYQIMDDCCLYVLIRVDDAVIFSSRQAKIEELKHVLKQEYQITECGALKYCLGLEIQRDRAQRTLSLVQSQYTRDVLERFGMSNCSIKTTPACPSINLCKSMSPENDEEREEMMEVPYLEALGALLYLSTCTRPDISMAVSELSKFSSNPGMEHWKGVKRVLRYLAGTIDYGLMYGGDDQRLMGYVDASYARCVDTRRSRYGGLLLLNHTVVEWKSKLSSTVAQSAMEAEYIGACEMAKITVWLRRTLIELKLLDDDVSIQIGIDNDSAKQLAEECMIQQRSKHIETKFHFIRERVAAGEISLFRQESAEMPADALTKPLGPKLFLKFRNMMGMLRVNDLNELNPSRGVLKLKLE